MSNDSKQKHQKRGTIVSFIPTGEYYFKKAIQAHEKGDYPKAKKYLERAMYLEPYEPMIPLQLAIVLTEMGNYEESNRLLYRILEELDASMVECHYFIANNYAYLGQFRDAYEHASYYLELEEDGEFAEEAEDFLDFLQVEAYDLMDDEQDELIVMQQEASKHLHSGNFKKAIQLFQRLIKEYPEYWSNYNNLSLAYFYVGQEKKADEILNEVLRKNPGNLHALCNKLVFAHYQKDESAIQFYKDILLKVKPLSLEHQYKLGSTFALIGEYHEAFSWLNRLLKRGFTGDGSFYYWLSYSAYFAGRGKMARKCWKKVLEINPEKAGLEPWNKEVGREPEDVHSLISKKLQSKELAERLFGIFLLSLSKKIIDITSSYCAKSQLEKEYLAFLKDNKGASNIFVKIGHNTAKQICRFHQPKNREEMGVFLLWFSVWAEMVKNKELMKNEKACAAAIEYEWRKLRHQQYSQQKLAQQYGLSVSTMQKYVKVIKTYLS